MQQAYQLEVDGASALQLVLALAFLRAMLAGEQAGAVFQVHGFTLSPAASMAARTDSCPW